jgi:hypothetical protein
MSAKSLPLAATENPDRLVGRKQIAEMFGLLPATIAMWQYRGQFPKPDYAPTSRTLRWKLSTVRKFMDGQK